MKRMAWVPAGLISSLLISAMLAAAPPPPPASPVQRFRLWLVIAVLVVGVVGFLDTGNVFARVANIAFTELRSAIGGGVRYKSPFGPIRLDIGFKVNRQPGEGLTAWFVSFGQAF